MLNNDLESMKKCSLLENHDKQVSLLYIFKLQDELRRANPDQINTFMFDYFVPLFKLILRDLSKINLRHTLATTSLLFHWNFIDPAKSKISSFLSHLLMKPESVWEYCTISDLISMGAS